MTGLFRVLAEGWSWDGTTARRSAGSELVLRFFSEKPVVFLPMRNKMISLLLPFIQRFSLSGVRCLFVEKSGKKTESIQGLSASETL